MNKINVIVFLLGMFFSTKAQVSSNYMDNFVKHIQVKENTQLVLDLMIKQYKESQPNVSPKFWDSLNQNIDYTDYLSKMKQAYKETYSKEELDELKSLYTPSTQKKFQEKSKKVAPKIYAISNEWGRNIANMIIRKAKAYKE